MATRSFDREEVVAYLLLEYPACPEEHHRALVDRISEREWVDAELPRAAGIAVTNYIRHQLTDYEMLMHHFKLTREEARINEADAVKELTAAWQVGAPERKRRKKRRRRRRKAKS